MVFGVPHFQTTPHHLQENGDTHLNKNMCVCFLLALFLQCQLPRKLTKQCGVAAEFA